MVVKFSGALNLTEVQDAMKYLKENVSPDAEVITAMEENNLLEDQVQVMVLITGIGAIPVQDQGLSNQETGEQLPVEVAEPASKSMLAGYSPADATPDDLEVPAFIRRGYNQVAHAFR
jgi:cell division protein FtsZ